MQGSLVEFYTTHDRQYQGHALSAWLIDEARRFGVPGATLSVAGSGFGQGRHLHSAHFFELADEPVCVRIIAEEALATRFMQHLEQLGLALFFVRMPVQFGKLGDGTHA